VKHEGLICLVGQQQLGMSKARFRENYGILSGLKFFGFAHNAKREIVSRIFAMFVCQRKVLSFEI
jgi:hypothetical protein